MTITITTIATPTPMYNIELDLGGVGGPGGAGPAGGRLACGVFGVGPAPGGDAGGAGTVVIHLKSVLPSSDDSFPYGSHIVSGPQ